MSQISPSLVSQSRIIWLVVWVCRWWNSPSSLLLFLSVSRLFTSLFLSFAVRFPFPSTLLWIVWLPRIGFSISYIGLIWEGCDIIITKACNNGKNLSMFYIMFYPPTSIPSLLPDRTKCTKNNEYPELFHTNIKALEKNSPIINHVGQFLEWWNYKGLSYFERFLWFLFYLQV